LRITITKKIIFDTLLGCVGRKGYVGVGLDRCWWWWWGLGILGEGWRRRGGFTERYAP
jgi:hypothetical protein